MSCNTITLCYDRYYNNDLNNLNITRRNYCHNSSQNQDVTYYKFVSIFIIEWVNCILHITYCPVLQWKTLTILMQVAYKVYISIKVFPGPGSRESKKTSSEVLHTSNYKNSFISSSVILPS